MERNGECTSDGSKIDLMKLLPLLLDEKPTQNLMVTPSIFAREMQLTTDERLEKLRRPTRKVRIRDEPSLNTFKAVPDAVIFQNFEIGGTYAVPLTLLNKCEASKPLRILYDRDYQPAFKISHSTEAICTKVAPGMTYQFNVIFTPCVARDHNHRIRFATDGGETFEVPLIAIAPRPLLDLPDDLALPTTPVKIESERTILVRNNGGVAGVFNACSDPPFVVHPARGVLGPGRCMQLRVSFVSETTGRFRGRMTFAYETGEKLTIGLSGSTVQADVYLEKGELVMDDTFMGLKTSRSVRLVNGSNHVVHFRFGLHQREAVENTRARFETIKESERMKDFALVESGVVENRRTHEVIYERIYVDEVGEFKDAAGQLFAYANPVFGITPSSGEIWPNSDAELLVVFAPARAERYQSTAFLEVTGREDRAPLRLVGSGVGPTVELNVEELDANKIFLCSVHKYEVVVRNIGDIPASVEYRPTASNFGGEITFSPERVKLEADDCASLVMRFFSAVQGKFVEEVQFVVAESGEVIKFIFKGDLISPVLSFDVPELSFCDVPLGYTVTKSVNLINDTQVPIEFNAFVEPDGCLPALSCEGYARHAQKPNVTRPREFSVSYEDDVVMPNSKVAVAVTLLPNLIGRHAKALKVHMWKSHLHAMALPIKYDCRIPHLACETKEVLIRSCYLHHPYNRTILIKNRNSYPGYFVVLPQEEASNGSEGVTCLPETTEGFIEANEEKAVELKISTNAVGQFSSHVYAFVFGAKSNSFLCTVVCNGQGPILTIPDAVNFGRVRTLKQAAQVIEIVNNSPISAQITVVKKAKSVYVIEEHDFELGPSDRKDLLVRVYFREPGAFAERITFDVANSERLSCLVKSTAVGSSILSEPELDGEFDAGRLFTHQRFRRAIRFTNMGSKFHKIIWSRRRSIRNWKETSQLEIASVFALTPNRFELAPGQSIECALEGLAIKYGAIEEDFYCHALVGGNKDFGVVSTYIVLADFVHPVLEISPDAMEFRVDIGVDGVSHQLLSDALTVKNTSKLPIVANVSVDAPFYVLAGDDRRSCSLQIELEHEELCEVRVEFVPVARTKRRLVSEGRILVTYDSHPHKLQILLRGEENYPSVELEPNVLDFGCSPNFSTSCKHLTIKNVSPLPVSYQWELIQDDFAMETLTGSFTPLRFQENFAGPCPCPPECPAGSRPSKPEYFKEIQVMLYQLVAKYDDDELEDGVEALRHQNEQIPGASPIQSILDLVPPCGYLAPFESQIVSLEFSPPPNASVKAKAHCHIAGGEIEVVPVSGLAADLDYSIDETHVEFGRVLFCEVSERSVAVRNTGFAAFGFAATSSSQSLSVKPQGGVVAPGETIQLNVGVLPALAGEFTERFDLEIAHFDPCTITVHGYAMPAQVVCSLPRPSVQTEDINLLSYEAIASLTDDFLRRPTQPRGHDPVEREEGWVVVTRDELCPSVDDVNLAIDRKLVNEHIFNEGRSALDRHATDPQKSQVLPELCLPPYVVDLGVVIRDTAARHTVPLRNYGPVRNVLRAQLDRSHAGFAIHVDRSDLDVGDEAQVFVVYRPTAKKHPSVNRKVNCKVFVSLSHGPKIPIEIRAFLTLPEISADDNGLVFEPVAMGNCCRKSVVFRNNGYVKSKWACEVRNAAKSRPAFRVKTRGGSCCEPGEVVSLDVYFEPKAEGISRASLCVTVEQNPVEVQVALKGLGVKPTLKITEPLICFPLTLPYAPDVEATFRIENVSPFPIEFYFADYDEAIDLEERMLRVVTGYYESRQIYLPLRLPGGGLPEAIWNFYYDLVNKVRGRLSLEDSQSDPLLSKSDEELEVLLAEELAILKRDCPGEEAPDPVLAAVIESRPSPLPQQDPTDEQPGILIIFHGASDEICQRQANVVGRVARLPVRGVDQLVIDALLESDSPAAVKINEIIDESFARVASNSTGEVANVANHLIRADKRDELRRKTDVLFAGSSFDIPEDFLCELLLAKLRRFRPGLVVESLRSVFFRERALSVLESVLRAIGNLQYIHCVITGQTYVEYVRREETRKQREEEAAAEARKRKVEEIAGVDAVGFANLSVEDRLLFKDQVLAPRKSEALAKREQLKIRLDGLGRKHIEEVAPPETTASSVRDAKHSKKNKSGEDKPTASSKASSKSNKDSIVAKPTEEEAEVMKEEELCRDVLHTLEFWDRKNCVVTKPLLERVGSKAFKKSKAPKSQKSSGASTVKSAADEAETSSDTGVTCWYFADVCDEEAQQLAERISFHLHHLSGLAEIKAAIERLPGEKEPSATETFTVISRPAVRSAKETRRRSDVFVLANQKGSTSEIASGGSRNSDVGSGKKRRRGSVPDRNSSISHSSKTRNCSTDGVNNQSEAEQLAPRSVIGPGEVVSYRARFRPTRRGHHSAGYAIELVGWPTRYEIELKGVCDVPELEAAFDRCVARKGKDETFEADLYVTETGVFDFGPILIPPDREDPRLFERLSTFRLRNKSSMTCEVALVLTPTKTFGLIRSEFSIAPDEVEDVGVTACPEKLGENEGRILVVTKGNPKVETVGVRCVGCEIEFRVEQRIVRFERGLLNVTDRKSVRLCNDSFVPVVWRIVDPAAIPDRFRVSALEGWMPPCGKQRLDFAFTPDAVEDVPRTVVRIDVYDGDRKLREAVTSDTLELSAEVIDAEVDFPTEIEFGEVKGKIAHTVQLPISSKSKYSVEFSFLDLATDESVGKLFDVSPRRLLLKSGEVSHATVSFSPTQTADFTDVPIFRCVAVDSVYKLVIKSADVKASAKTYLSSYELCPPDQIDFGHQLIGAEKYEQLFLRNTGRFEFTYTVLGSHKLVEQKDKKLDRKAKKMSRTSSSKTSSKTSATGKGKNRKRNKAEEKAAIAAAVAVGCFSISPSTGVARPNETVPIRIACRPDQDGPTHEKILVFVSECAPGDRKGRTINLNATGATPKFNFDNYAAVFNEHYVVEDASEDVLQFDFHCVFVASERRLHFNNVCVNTVAKARIRLQNVGLVPAELIAAVTSSSKGQQAFSVETERVRVDPYDYGYVTLRFAPDEMGDFAGALEVTCGAPLPTGRLQIGLSGEGIVPEVAILEPEGKEHRLSFGPTPVGRRESKAVCFENRGVVTCRVILEVCRDVGNVLSLRPIDADSSGHTTVVALSPKQKAAFEVEFAPESEVRLDAVLKLHVVDNPFEILQVSVRAIGFSEDVILEGLPTVANWEASPTARYGLYFGLCAMNTLQRKCFKIVNRSDADVYRFDFTNYDKLIFVPAVGHLKPGACKEVLATFLTKEPVDFHQETVNCVVCKIVYARPQLEALSWDQRQNVVVWNRATELTVRSGERSKSSRIRCLEDRSEPEHAELPGTSRTIRLLLTITADYCSYRCDVEEIALEDTLMFDERSTSFSVANTSNVPLRVDWVITMDERYPKRINSSRSQSLKQKLDEETPSSTTRNARPQHLTGKELFLTDDCTTPTRTSLFSSFDDPATGRSNVSWCDRDVAPFALTPAFADVPPGAEQTFTLTFHPDDVAQYVVHLKSDVANTKMSPIDVTVSARSLLPPYYFDLEPSKYFARGENDARVVRFEVVGPGGGIADTRKFHVINPTGENFQYNWIGGADEWAELFRCHAPNGLAANGKATEAVFSFVPDEIGEFQAWYTFRVDKYDLETRFLLSGRARNPRASFSMPHLKLRATVLEIDVVDESSVALRNDEDVELDFSFAKASLYSSDRVDRLSVEPSQGATPPRGQIPIKITYHPVRTGEVTFGLKCYIGSAKKPLSLAVTAKCFDVRAIVSHVIDDAETTLDPMNVSDITLDSLVPMKSEDVTFAVRNRGEIGFYYAWSCSEKFVDAYAKLAIGDEEGFVVANGDATCVISVKPVRPLRRKRIKLKLQVLYGPSYTVRLNLTTVKAKYKFSSTACDFGPCLVQRDKTTRYRRNLEFTNCDDAMSLTLECGFADQNGHLSVAFGAKEVAPGVTETIALYFHPRSVAKYVEDVPFYVNSKPVTVKVRGEGVPVVVEVEKPRDRIVDLGAVMSGRCRTTSVRVVNKSACAVRVAFELLERLPYFSQPCHAAKALDAEKQDGSIRVSPKDFTKLTPGASCELSIKFSPAERMGAFSRKVCYQVQDHVGTVCVLKASCIAADYRLARDTIAFGNVVKNSSVQCKFALYNVGDVGGRYSWKFEKRGERPVAIAPMEGYLSPDASVTFTSTFHPIRTECQVKYKASCLIEHFDKALEVTFTGTCVDLPPPASILRFACPVRSEAKSNIVIDNPTNTAWQLLPVLNGEYFHAPESIAVGPCSSAECALTYRPKIMTFDGLPHKGTLRLNLGNGDAISHLLEGTSLEPLSSGEIEREIICKTQHVETLVISNWLNAPQTFKVITRSLPPQSEPSYYRLTGNPIVDVPANGKREYKWIVCALKEGTLRFHVVFVNEATREYLFYELRLVVTRPEAIEEISLKTRVRVGVSHRLTLENPTAIAVTYAVTSGCSDWLRHDGSVTVEPFGARHLDVEYLPLLPGRSEAVLEAKSAHLGAYPYKFVLLAEKARAEPPVQMTTCLGLRCLRKIEVRNRTKAVAVFTSRIGDDEKLFSVGQAALTVEPERSGCFDVAFEPDDLGSFRSTLTLVSSVAGEYTYPLIGTSERPKPRGPIRVRPGGCSPIDFRNPFGQARSFHFTVEPEQFYVKNQSETVGAKTSTRINVFLRAADEVVAGKLTATCTLANSTEIAWVYYLQSEG